MSAQTIKDEVVYQLHKTKRYTDELKKELSGEYPPIVDMAMMIRVLEKLDYLNTQLKELQDRTFNIHAIVELSLSRQLGGGRHHGWLSGLMAQQQLGCELYRESNVVEPDQPARVDACVDLLGSAVPAMFRVPDGSPSQLASLVGSFL